MEDNSVILNELGAIKAGIIAIQEELSDRILTREDIIAIENYKKEKENNCLISHEELKKELGRFINFN